MARSRFPFYHLVPKDFDENLKFRRDVLNDAKNDPAFQRELQIMCSRDILFWCNTFCWCQEPREALNAAVRTDAVDCVVPFITWELQDENIERIQDCIGRQDICIRKSRETAGTWTVLLVFTHEFDYMTGAQFLVVSRDARRVDIRGDYATLLPKIDFLHENMPAWLRPPIDRNVMVIRNLQNGALIKGESTTGEIARSGRYRAVLLDEHGFFKLRDGYRANAATLGATPCRIFLSTYNGTGNAYADKDEDPDIVHVSFPWWKDPRKNPGLYEAVNGKLVIHDRHYKFPPDYEFILDGKLRSPWRDAEGRREKDPTILAGEVDMDKNASKSRYFPQELIKENIQKHAREPDFIGELEYDVDTLEPISFREDPNGRLRLWLPRPNVFTDREGFIRPQPFVRYILGADVSAGTGKSNSAASIAEMDTRIKVAEWVDAWTDEVQFAWQCIALCHWFNGAFAIWDALGGLGQTFGRQFVDRGYLNVYFRQSEERLSSTLTDRPGFYASHGPYGGRMTLLSYYRTALTCAVIDRDDWPEGATQPYYNPSKESLEECTQYIFAPDGGVVHAKGRETTDPSGAKSNHADRCFSDALTNYGMVKYGGQETPPPAEEEIDEMTMQGRMRAWELEQEERNRPGQFRLFQVRR